MSASSLLLPLLVLLAIVGIYFIIIYTRLQSLKNGAEATLSQIRVAMKKRLDSLKFPLCQNYMRACMCQCTWKMLISGRMNMSSLERRGNLLKG